MKKICLLPIVTTLLTANMAFAADEIHWTVTGKDSVTFDWRGNSTENSIGYGLTSGNYTQVTAATPNPVPVSSQGPFWEAKLTGLTANTRYYYKIGNAPERSFRTAPTPGSSDFHLYAQGNIGSSSPYFNMGIVQDLITSDLPAFVVGLGDFTLGSKNGKAAVDQHFNDVMVWSKEAAYMPVWGDLDTITSANDGFKNYKGRFAVPNPQTSPGSPLAGGEDWYWFDYGNVRFITLPERWTGAWADWNTKAQALMAQAQADPGIKFIVTFVHRPAYSSGHFPGSSTLKGFLDTLGDTYSKYQLNVNAHSNNYERSFPQHGVTHVTAGTGGADLTQDGTCLWLTCTKPAWSAFRAMHLGALKLRFTASSIEGSFICGPAGGGTNDVNCTKGSVLDKFTISPIVAPSASNSLTSAVPIATAATTSSPDVIVTQLSYTNGIFTSMVKNQGTAAIPVGVTIGLAYFVDGSFRTWGAVTGPLAAGASVTIGTNGGSYTIPTGTHTIMAWVDDMNRFAESVETNNQLSRSVTIGTTTTTPGDSQAPTVPTQLAAKASSSSQINLTWSAATDNVGVTGYKIFRNGSQVGTSTTIAYSDSGLTGSTSHTYTVAAYDAASNSSGNSTAVTATTSGTASTSNGAIEGFAAAAGVTGGAGGQNIVVTNLNEYGSGSLHAAMITQGPRNVTFTPGLSGVINFTAAHFVTADNMTINGAGANITISGYNLNLYKTNDTAIKNIIIKNLTFANQVPTRNAIWIDGGSYNIWIDHCTFRNNSHLDANGVGLNGQGIAIWDRGLGKGGLNGITISWNKFEAPNIKALLIASTDDSIPLSTKVSIHHNWFDNIIARSPRLGAVTAHMWNNYTSNWGEYGTAISGAGDLLAQNNIYEKSNGGKAIDANYGNLNSNSVNATGNLRLGNPLPVIETRGTFPMSKINYSVTPEVADNALKQRLIQGAGANHH